ncbi:hypothetical protein D3C75_870430 [compost metagenome]
MIVDEGDHIMKIIIAGGSRFQHSVEISHRFRFVLEYFADFLSISEVKQVHATVVGKFDIVRTGFVWAEEPFTEGKYRMTAAVHGRG